MALSKDEAQRRLIGLHRFGLGARPGSAPTGDARELISQELRDPAAALVTEPGLMTTQAALQASFAEQRDVQRMRSQSRDEAREMRVARGRQRTMPDGDGQPSMGAPGMMAEGQAGSMAAAANRPQQEQPNVERDVYRAEAMARIKKAHEFPVGYVERLVLFWSNHFCVSAQKGQLVRATAGAMERECIRPHVLGHFSDMLLAVEKHPAMQVYLDNRQSVGPNSRAGQNRRLGLNENLAREILELHTLGVNGGYSQADVTSLARILTGWGFVGGQAEPERQGRFEFTPNRHEPGEHVVIGRGFPDTGAAQGEHALQFLARHPATAKHVATKLVRHFVSDTNPPAALIAKLAKVFSESDGDLAKVSRTLVEDEYAWNAPLTRMRNPYEWLAAITRIGGPPQNFGQVIGPLNQMAMPVFTVPGPNGYPETNAHWMSPEAMRNRLDLSAIIARRLSGRFNPSELAVGLFDTALSAETAQAIRRAESREQGMAILLMSPEFLMR